MIKDFIFSLVLIVGCITLGTFLWDLREDLNRSPAIKERLGHAACVGGVVACIILVVFGSILLQAASRRSAPYRFSSRRTPWQDL